MEHVVAVQYSRNPSQPRQRLDTPPAVAVYLPVRGPVQAVQFNDAASLKIIATWIRYLYRYGLDPGWSFYLDTKGAFLRQVDGGLQAINVGDLIAYDGESLAVYPAEIFQRLYRPLGQGSGGGI